ncbi:uncharacterized protein G2W53_036913 [Senna tora]|uniref:Uncharacterized protein n=1 Tax=Senna tora TaxID=362788 RepID=A0A834W585_9FABA|nr:uncharacterized protein G2W53_036913 [Senna tora]
MVEKAGIGGGPTSGSASATPRAPDPIAAEAIRSISAHFKIQTNN